MVGHSAGFGTERIDRAQVGMIAVSPHSTPATSTAVGPPSRARRPPARIGASGSDAMATNWVADWTRPTSWSGVTLIR